MADEVIVVHADYRRRNERRLTSGERAEIERRNRRKRSAPAACWECIHYTHCSMRNLVTCSRWKEDENRW